MVAVGLRQRFYTYASAFARAGTGREPPAEMKAAVAGAELAGAIYWGPPESTLGKTDYWRRILDPRIDFYPPGSQC